MKLEAFFNKFDELADTPNGVKQLRELVMHLAVEGGLVPHSAAEPAVPYASVEDAEPINVSDVPENWRVVLLADAIKNRSGNSKLIKGKLHEEPAAGRFQGFSASGADVWCDDYEHEGQAIIISAVGARCGKAFKASGKWCAIANTNITRPEPSLFDFDFAYLVLNNEHFWVRGGSAQPFVKFPPSLDRHFALPPLAEQKRIVAKVDELMALCDRLEVQQQERETRHAALARASLARFADAPTPANLPFLFHPSYAIPPADLRKSILTLAVQGKLVPQDPNDELPQIPSDGQTVGDSEWVSRLQLPDTWLWARFESLLAVLKNGFNGKPSKVVGKFKITRIETISRETVDLARVGYADDLPADVVAKHAVLKGDILFSHINSEPHLGKTAICTIDDPTLVHGVNLLLLRPIAGIDSRYLNIALRELRAAGYFVSIAQRAVNQASINQKNLGKTPISIPPLAEQRRIVAKVEQLMALVDALETQLASSRATAANLLSALVAEITNP